MYRVYQLNVICLAYKFTMIWCVYGAMMVSLALSLSRGIFVPYRNVIEKNTFTVSTSLPGISNLYIRHYIQITENIEDMRNVRWDCFYRMLQTNMDHNWIEHCTYNTINNKNRSIAIFRFWLMWLYSAKCKSINNILIQEFLLSCSFGLMYLIL